MIHSLHRKILPCIGTVLTMLCITLAAENNAADLQADEPIATGQTETQFAEVFGLPEMNLDELDAPPFPPPGARPPAPEAAPAPDATPDEPDVFIVPDDTNGLPQMIKDENGNNLISINLDEVPLQDVVRMLTRITDANIVASGTNLQQAVTVSLHNVEWKTAMDSILDMHNLTLREITPDSEVYSIVPKAPDAVEPLIIRPLFLKYAGVNDAQTIVRALLEPRGSVSPYPSGNALIIRSTAANLADIEKVLDSIDIPRQQVYIEAKFLELNDDAIQSLGINWQVLESYRVGVGSFGWSMQERREWDRSSDDSFRLFDTRTQTDDMSALYDREGRRYDSFDGQGDPTRSVSEQMTRGREVSTDHSDVFSHTVQDLRSAVLSAGDLNIILSALQGMDGVSIVSNPKIIVANEETATIHIGEKERPFVSAVVPQPDAPAIVTYNPGEVVDFGVKLSVTPTINTDSNITIKISPQLTRFVRNAVAPDGQSYPIVATKTIDTIFSLENGKTAAIGGLTETMERDVTRKVPLLGDIPLIGRYLFSHEKRETAQQETIIFVTVSLANPHNLRRNEGLPEDAELVFRHMRQQELRRQQQLEQDSPADGARRRSQGALWRR